MTEDRGQKAENRLWTIAWDRKAVQKIELYFLIVQFIICPPSSDLCLLS